MTDIAQAWRRWQARKDRRVVHSRWLRQIAAERRLRAERAMHAAPGLASELVRILGHHEDLDEHFILGFTAKPDPIDPEKRLSDGFAAMALRCEQLRAEALFRQRLELKHGTGRAA